MSPNRKNWLVNGVTTMGAAIPRPFRATGFILLLCIGIAGAEEKRSPKWAQPIKLEGTSMSKISCPVRPSELHVSPSAN